jgi:hypothetical protein
MWIVHGLNLEVQLGTVLVCCCRCHQRASFGRSSSIVRAFVVHGGGENVNDTNATYLSKIFAEECGIALRNAQVVLWSPGLSKARVEREDIDIAKPTSKQQASNGSEQLGDEKDDDLADLERLKRPGSSPAATHLSPDDTCV